MKVKILAACFSLVLGLSSLEASHPFGHYTRFYSAYPPAVVYHSPVVYQPVFAAPATVVVQRPVYVAHPVVAPEPVFVETPVYTTPPVVQTPVMPAGYTTVRYRGPLLFGHRDKLEYRVHTPYGTHKYKYRTSWKYGGTRFSYEFDD